jgi:hypothetical protein
MKVCRVGQDNTNYKHGFSGTKLHNCWRDMRFRVNNKTWKKAHCYSGRGITVCQEWLDFMVFREWALINGYIEGLTLDRKDNNGNYTPDNCRWITHQEQAFNQRVNRGVSDGRYHKVE